MTSIKHIKSTVFNALLITVCLSVNQVVAKDNMTENNIVNLSATVSKSLSPDTAVVVLAAEKNHADAAVATEAVNKLMSAALVEVKKTAEIAPATGQFSTYQQYDNKGQVTAWVVRSELILKSKDFVMLGKTVGQLSRQLKIVSSAYEVSRTLKQAEEEQLIVQGLAAFQSKAKVATSALGFSNYQLRTVNLESAQLEGAQQRPLMVSARGVASMDAAAPMPLEAGNTNLSLTVTGSVQMR